MGSSTKRILFIGLAVLAIGLVGGGAFAISTWGSVNRVSIDRPTPTTVVEDKMVNEDEGDSSSQVEEAMDEDPSRAGLDVLLLVGSDSREELDDLEGFGDFEGQRADVVMVMLRSDRGSALLSLPRDLYIDNDCFGRQTRINVLLEGCGDSMNGATLLTLAVEDLIGVGVDHFAMVDLAGFQSAVDAIGGYEICVDNPVRDRRSNLELPAGCTVADGEQTLAWVRSRRTQELTDSGWRTMAGMSDLARNERQRQFLIDITGQLGDFSSPAAMASAASALAPFVTVDSGLTLAEAVDIAWALRSMGSSSVQQLDVPVYHYTTDEGASVLLPSTPVDEVVAEYLAVETAAGLLYTG